MDLKRYRTLTRRSRYASSREYAMGYLRGLRRHYHGENFGTPDEHALWMSLGLDGDPRVDLGCGYRDGVAGREPAVMTLNDPSLGEPDWLQRRDQENGDSLIPVTRY